MDGWIRWTLAATAAGILSASPAIGQERLDRVDPALVKRGEQLFTNKGCVACHTIGKGRLVGPDLKGVTERRDVAWLTRYLKAPSEMLKTDSIAKALLAEANGVPMPDLGLKDDEITALLHYLKDASGR